MARTRFVIRLMNPEVIMWQGYIIQPTPQGYYVYPPIDTIKPLGKLVKNMDDALDYIDWVIFGDDEEE